jgi:hypothetical protein
MTSYFADAYADAPDVPDPDVPSPDEPRPSAPPPSSPPTSTPGVGRLTAATIGAMTAEQREAWLEGNRQQRKDPLHPINDDRHPEHAAALAEFEAVIMGPADNPVLGEVFANGQIRPLDASALSPAPRPALPDGYAFDEPALVLAETEAHAMGARPSLIMEITDALAEIVEQAEHRGVGWSEADAAAELQRRYGRDGAARLADNARFAYQTLLESEHPLLVQRVRELGEAWGDDPGVIALFGTLVYQALTEGDVTPAKEALILRRAEKLAKAEAEGRARAAKTREDQDAEDDEARAAAMTYVAVAHRRWGRVEP